MNVGTSAEGMQILSLIMNASLLVKGVMLILLLASLTSWYMIFNKWLTLKGASFSTGRFERRFWSGVNLNQMFNDLSGKKSKQRGITSIFLDGYRELKRLSGHDNLETKSTIDGVQRAMRVALIRETDSLETNLPFLATVGSTSPYIGLFGTVWGIMNSFRALGATQQATLAQVAPGIAEALIATAMGLFAAIPAVIAYNRYSNKVDRLITRYEIFVEEFINIVQRQSFRPKS